MTQRLAVIFSAEYASGSAREIPARSSFERPFSNDRFPVCYRCGEARRELKGRCQADESACGQAPGAAAVKRAGYQDHLERVGRSGLASWAVSLAESQRI